MERDELHNRIEAVLDRAETRPETVRKIAEVAHEHAEDRLREFADYVEAVAEQQDND